MTPMQSMKPGIKLSLLVLWKSSEVSSSPNATMNFGKEKVDTHYSTHKKTTASIQAVVASKEKSHEKDSSKASAKAKASDGQQSDIKLDDDGFKTLKGRAKHLKKKIEVSECLEIVARVIAQDKDPESILVKEVKVTNEITPYGLESESESESILFDPRHSNTTIQYIH